MTEPIPRVNWQCPKCLRKWSVPAGRKAPAQCRECAKLTVSTVVHPSTQSGTPPSEKRDNSPDSIASNGSQYCLWTCPRCQKPWRVRPDNTSRAYCKSCGPAAEWEERRAQLESELAELPWYRWLTKRDKRKQFDDERSQWINRRAAELKEFHRREIERREAVERQSREDERRRTEAAIRNEKTEQAIREYMDDWMRRETEKTHADPNNEEPLPITEYERSLREKRLRQQIEHDPGFFSFGLSKTPAGLIKTPTASASSTETSGEVNSSPQHEPPMHSETKPSPTKPKIRFRNPELARQNWADHHRPINLNNLSGMSGVQFEHWLIRLLKKLDYQKVKPTRQSGDFGGDITATLPFKSTVICIQAKFLTAPAGVKAIYEVLGGMHQYEADVGVVASWSGFTNSAIKLADKACITLWGRDEIAKMVSEIPVPSLEFDGERYRAEVLQPFYLRERDRRLDVLASQGKRPNLFQNDSFEDTPSYCHQTMPKDFEGPSEGILEYENRVIHGVGKKEPRKAASPSMGKRKARGRRSRGRKRR